MQIARTLTEHQYFAKVFEEIKLVADFTPASLDQRVAECLEDQGLITRVLENPRLRDVLDQAKAEVADSIFFHASGLNQIIYNFSWKTYKENSKEERKTDEKPKEKPLLGSLRTLYEETYLYPVNSMFFVIVVILAFCFLQRLGNNSLELFFNFVKPMIGLNGEHFGHSD